MGPDDSPKPRRRLAETAAFLLAEAGGALPIVSVNKGLFYSDLRALRDLGHQITEAKYIALKAGPVVCAYERHVIDALERTGIAQQEELEDGSKPLYLITDFAPKALTADEQEIVRAIAKWAKSESPTELSNFSHKTPAWQKAWNSACAGKALNRDIDMMLALQQIVEADPWLDVAPSSEERSLFVAAHASDAAEAVPW
jgi:uncharacterized phage-associated protein